MKTINVSADSSGINLSNNGNATSPKKGKVKWNVTSPSIQSIKIIPSIKSDTIQIDIWKIKPKPFPKKTSKNWQGTIGDTVGEEYYSVDWIKTDGSHGTIDPVIRVRPTRTTE
jgi:hypothetical protein